MPHEAHLSTYLPDSLVHTLQDIAKDFGWPMTKTYDEALKSFYRALRSRERPHRYCGCPSDARPRTLWVAQSTGEAIRTLAKVDKVSTALVILEGLRWYCHSLGRPVTFTYEIPHDFLREEPAD